MFLNGNEKHARKLRRQAAGLAIILLLSACEGVGIPATSDPYTKLAQAHTLWRDEGRVMQARRLVEQAIVIFNERGDKAGLAQAYWEYGLVARVGGANVDPVIYYLHPEMVAQHQPTPEELHLSDEYLARSAALANEAKRLDIVFNANLFLGDNQVLRGNNLQSCAFYDLALAAAHDANRQQPEIGFDLPKGTHSIDEFVESVKHKAFCPPA
jgi:hypothetical protein